MFCIYVGPQFRGLMCLDYFILANTGLSFNRACHPSSHYLDFCHDALFLDQFITTQIDR